jgi:ankyrin repeat protein
MFFAVMNKNPEIKEIIELLIKSGSDLNVTDKDGRNVLLYAAIYKYIQAIKPLMELGVNINSTDNQGRTFFSLMTSTEYYPAYEYKEIINEFIKLGADINKCDKAGMSPLMYAIVNSNTEAFEILINAGADVSLKDFKGYDFVDYLEQSSDTEAIDKIIKIAEQKNIISQDRIVQLYSAREKYNQMVSDFNHVEVNLPDIVMEPAKTPDINEILSQISDINKQDEEGKTFLMFMCEQGCDIETVKTIVKAGIDINIKDSNDQTALMLAAQKCSPQIVHFLINAGADIKSVRQDSKNILMYAAQNNDSNVVDMFIKKIDVNALMKDNWTALMFAARDGSTETVKKLIKAGADVKAKTVNGKDLLLNAIDHDNIETMKLFIDAGADVTSKRSDYHGDPLHWAGFMSQKKETILFLIDQITKKEKPDEYIFEALDSALFNFDNSYASKEVLDCLKDVAKKTDSERYKNSLANTLAEQARSISSTQKIQELIDDGADPNGHDKFGATILMNAAQNEIPEIIQVILKYDVDIDAVSGGNKYTALHYAVAFNPNIKIAKILIEAGADIKNNQTYGNLGEVAAKNKNPEMIQFLKDYDLYNDIDNGKALAEAACNSNLTQVKQLISSGVTKEELSKALLNAAQHKFNGIRSMELEIIKELVNAGADVNVKYDAPTQWTVLMLLCGDIYTPTEVIQFLVDKGADVNAKANGKHTPLLAASGEGTPEIVKILVNAGANMEDKNFRDQTPLLMALAHNKLQNFDMLVSLGAKVNGSNSYALLSGALLGYSQNKNEMFEMLMSVGVDINATNKDGQNILMGLCQLSDDISLIQMVLDNGADITMRDTKGNDAQYYLQRNKSLKDSDILTKKN